MWFLIALSSQTFEETFHHVLDVVHQAWPQAVVFVGDPVNNVDEMSMSMRSASELMRLSTTATAEKRDTAPVTDLRRNTRVEQTKDYRLRLLIRQMRSSPELAQYVQQSLGKLLQWDKEHHGDLLEVLRAYLKQPANRSAAATQSHVSRSVFYQRLNLIEELLSLDLNSGESIASLYSAVIAHEALHGKA